MLLQIAVLVGIQLDLKTSRRPSAPEASIDRGHVAVQNSQLQSASFCMPRSQLICVPPVDLVTRSLQHESDSH